MKRIFLVIVIAALLTGSYIFLNYSIAASFQSAADGSQNVNIVEQNNQKISQESLIRSNQRNNAWLNKALQQVVDSEYQISWQTETYLDGLSSAYQAPNRGQNLRSYFSSDGIHIIRRTNSASSWQLGLSFAGFGSRTLPEAQITSYDNRIEYQRLGITEWFVNLPSGIQHSFSIASHPASALSDHELIVALDIDGDLTPSYAEDHSSIVFNAPGGAHVIQYRALEAYDARHRTLPVLLQLSAENNQVLLVIDTTDVLFPISFTQNISSLLVPEASESLGPSYDWGTVGADESGKLGYSVSTAGDVNNDGHDDVILGAPTWDFGHEEEGAAFLFMSNGSGLMFTYTWMIQADQDRAHLGTAVSDAGDVNNDGYDDVVIGAIDYDNGLADQGRVFVMYGMEDGLTDTLRTVIDGEAENAHFGETVASAGDVNNDGFDEIIVGTPSYNNGKVYLYKGSGSGVSTTPDWTATNSSVTNLGVSVHTAGDINNDGYDDVIIGGSVLATGIGGRAFVYYGSASGLPSTIGWTGSGSTPVGEYGHSVCTAGDVNGDGYDDIIVGAPTENLDAGKVYVYHGSSSGLSQTASWTKTGSQSNAQFGYSVSMAGDVNGDGYDDIIVGAPYFNDTGRAFAHLGSAAGMKSETYWFSDPDAEQSEYGWSVSNAGNVNGDRTDDVIVGAPSYEVALPNQGVTLGFYGLPDADAENDSPTLIGEATYFTATISTSGDFEYEWDFGDELTGTGQTVSHTYALPGDYMAEVTIIDEVYEITATTMASIQEMITGLSASNDSPTTLGNPTGLSASVVSGTHVIYEWDFGDGSSTQTGESVNHIYQAIGSYTATVTAANGVSSESAETSVLVEEAITGLSATNDGPTVLGETTTLSATAATGSNITYEWDFGDGSPTETGQVVTHAYASVGSYTATVTATNIVSSQSTTTMVYIDVVLTGLSASNDSPTVLGNITTLSASTTGGTNITYEWDFGDGSPIETGQMVTHVYASAGSYTAAVTASNSVSSQSTTTLVKVDQTIAGLNATNDGPTALGSMTTLSASTTAGTNITYEWDFGDGTPKQTGQMVTHTYAAVGSYTATVTATNSVSNQSTTTPVTVDQTITGLSASNDSPKHIGEVTTLTASISTGSNVTYEWDFGDSSPKQAGQVVTHVYAADGIYTAKVTATNSVSSANTTTEVIIGDVIAGLTATNNGPTVLGQSTTLTADIISGTSVTYEWDFGDGTPKQSGKSVVHQYAAVGSYVATVTATNHLGQSTATTTVYLDVLITGLSATNDGPTLIGDLTTLSAHVATGTNVVFTWDLGDGSPLQNGQVINHKYPAVQSFSAEVFASNSVSQISKMTVVVINPLKLFLPIIIYK